jgi:hypothetical protein
VLIQAPIKYFCDQLLSAVGSSGEWRGTAEIYTGAHSGFSRWISPDIGPDPPCKRFSQTQRRRSHHREAATSSSNSRVSRAGSSNSQKSSPVAVGSRETVTGLASCVLFDRSTLRIGWGRRRTPKIFRAKCIAARGCSCRASAISPYSDERMLVSYRGRPTHWAFLGNLGTNAL